MKCTITIPHGHNDAYGKPLGWFDGPHEDTALDKLLIAQCFGREYAIHPEDYADFGWSSVHEAAESTADAHGFSGDEEFIKAFGAAYEKARNGEAI